VHSLTVPLEGENLIKTMYLFTGYLEGVDGGVAS
jgi:hypothetical protein